MNKQIAILSALIIMGLGVCVWLIQKPTHSEFEPQLLFADLSSVATKIDSVTIENSSGVLFKSVKTEDNWLAEVGYNGISYPADKKKLAQLINTLLQVKLIEAKTSKKANLDRLGLQAITQEDSLARLVTITVANKTWQVLVGNQVSVGEGSYVRLPKELQSWRLDKRIDLPFDQYDWLLHPILSYAAEDIQSVARVDGQQWQINRQGDANEYALANLPADRTLQYEGVLAGFVSSLLNLDYEELVAPEDTFVASLSSVAELSIVTKDEQQISVLLSQAKDIYYLNYTSNDSSNQYWQNHYYQISDFSAQQINKVFSDFLAEESEQQEQNLDIVPIEQSAIDEGAPES